MEIFVPPLQCYAHHSKYASLFHLNRLLSIYAVLLFYHSLIDYIYLVANLYQQDFSICLNEDFRRQYFIDKNNALGKCIKKNPLFVNEKACVKELNDNADKFGFVSKTGEVVIPHVLTRLYEPVNDFMLLEDEGKFGALDTDTFSFVLPEYDSVDCAPEQDVIFVKDGIEGYVIEETGEFVPKTQFEADDDKYGDAYVYNTYIND